ncbi:MAG: moaR1, partial [Evtepia sp.]|nr:moaR1 [Evtepia sp.]
MEYSDILLASMLGSCRLTYEGKALDSKNVRSKRIWTLLAYLITNRHRAVTQNELIELLYPNDKSEAPLSALKTLVHRTRSALNKLEFADGKLLIQQSLGGYRWNRDLPLEVDVESFETIANEASKLSGDQDVQLQTRLRAIDLYKGDFLADFLEEAWIIPVTSYYRYLFMDTVILALEGLMERNRYSDLIGVAQKAIGINPYEERLYYYLVSALIHTNQIPAAKTQYENMTKLFYSEFGVTPSKELQSLYKKLTNANNGIEKDLNIITTQMQDDVDKRGAYYCEYEFFKDIYKLVIRTVVRDEKPVHICLLSINPKEANALPPK